MLGIVIVYLIALFGVGIWANKYNENVDDFLLAGRRLGFGLATFTLIATYFGGGFVIGAGEMAYESGMISWWSGLSGGIGLILVGFMAYKLRDLALYTVPDYLYIRYKSNALRAVSAILSLIALVGILAAQVGAASKIFQIFGMGSMTAGILASLTFIIFTAVGGLWAATITDFIQIIIAAVGLIYTAIVVIGKLGGWGSMVTLISSTNIPKGYFNLMGNGDISVVLWLTLPLILYTLIGQDVYQRILATKDGKTARNSCVAAGILICIITVFPVLIGIGAKGLYPNLENLGLAIPKIITELLPTFAAGLLVSAILAAIISTGDSILTAATSHLINDIYIKIIKKDEQQDNKALLGVSRIATLVIGLFSLVVAALIPKIISLLLMSYTLYTSGVFIPVLGGFVWKKSTLQGAMAALVTGLIIAVAGISGFSIGGVPTEILSSIISGTVFIVVSLMTYKDKVTM